MTTARVGRKGTVAILAVVRRRFGLEAGVPVVTEAREDGILVRPAAPSPDADRHRRLIEDTNRAYAALREDTASWDEELAERALWDVTLLDGLDDHPGTPTSEQGPPYVGQ